MIYTFILCIQTEPTLQKELVDMAVSIGLRAMALTDHDTIDGVPHAIEAARDYDITIIPGCRNQYILPGRRNSHNRFIC